MKLQRSEWPTKRIRFATRRGLSSEQRRLLSEATQVTFLPMESIGEQGQIDVSSVRDIEELNSGYTRFFDGDVVVAKITPCFENGKGALVSGTLSGVGFGTTELHVLSPDSDLDGRFLYYVTAGPPFRRLGEACMTGAAGQKRVPEDFVRDYRIHMPPLRHQRAIADYLDRETTRLDALVAAKERLVGLLAEKRRALITRAVTLGIDPHTPVRDSGIPWLGTIPAHWRTTKFTWAIFMIEGQVDPAVDPYLDMPLIAPNHIESGTGRLIGLETAAEQGAISGKYLCRNRDVIYSKIRPALRKATIAPTDCLCSADMYPLRARDGLLPEFLLLFLLSEPFSIWAVLESNRVAMPKINRESLGDIRIPVPPLAEQQALVDKAAQNREMLDKLYDAAERTIALLKERRSALIAAAVTGQIDVGAAA